MEQLLKDINNKLEQMHWWMEKKIQELKKLAENKNENNELKIDNSEMKQKLTNQEESIY